MKNKHLNFYDFASLVFKNTLFMDRHLVSAKNSSAYKIQNIPNNHYLMAFTRRPVPLAWLPHTSK